MSTPQVAKQLAEDLRERITGLGFKRHKLIVQVRIMRTPCGTCWVDFRSARAQVCLTDTADVNSIFVLTSGDAGSADRSGDAAGFEMPVGCVQRRIRVRSLHK